MCTLQSEVVVAAVQILYLCGIARELGVCISRDEMMMFASKVSGRGRRIGAPAHRCRSS